MPLIRPRPAGRRVLSMKRDPRVGYWHLASVLEVCHAYHDPGSPGSDRTLHHRFFYRNFYPETFIFRREVDVNGADRYTIARQGETLEIPARVIERNPDEEEEHPVPGSLHVSRSTGLVKTAVSLKPEGQHRAALPSKVDLRSIYHADDIRACPCCT